MRSGRTRVRSAVAAALATACLAATAATAAGNDEVQTNDPTTTATHSTAAAAAPAARKFRPEDRYAMANGCYAIRSLGTGAYLVRSGSGFAATGRTLSAAEAFFFEPYDLGKYLLFGRKSDFLASSPDPLPGGVRPLTDPAEGSIAGLGDEALDPVRKPILTTGELAEDAIDENTASRRQQARGTGVVAATKPSAAAEWVVLPAGRGAFTLRRPVNDHDEGSPGLLDPKTEATLTTATAGVLAVRPGEVTGREAFFGFERTSGCAAWPESQVNVRGTPAHGSTAYEQTQGHADAHLHLAVYEFLGGKARCARPWHPYGVTYALVDCPDHEPGGRGGVMEAFLSGQNPGTAHDTTGWPTFADWPRHDSLTHEQVYYRWLERAWAGGLRLASVLLTENVVLCEIYPYKRNSCNEMDSVRLQAQRVRELERYIDAQSGGPGEGWFRVITDPFQARRVINAGKLAVVLGIEVSVPLECGEIMDVPRCNVTHVEPRMHEVYSLGVRQMQMANKFDNGFTGVTGDSGNFGVLVNNANKFLTGQYWRMQTCAEAPGHKHHQHQHDKTQYNVADQSGGAIGRDAIFGGVLQVFGSTGAAPVYPQGPHCNADGLTSLGQEFLRAIRQRGMIFDPDHMSAKGRQQALGQMAQAGYPGVMSSHTWADDVNERQILRMGGVVSPAAETPAEFVSQWRKQRSWLDGRFTYGLGFGSDTNGFSAQPPPRNPKESADVDYPIRGLGGVLLDRQVTGKRSWDINTDGVAHQGIYPDWVEDVRVVAGKDGPKISADMARAAEAYLQMWERAVGTKPNSCRVDIRDLTRSAFAQLRRGMTPEQVLKSVGQPHTRIGQRFTYCVDGRIAAVTFGRDGRLARTGRA
ncbi:MAG TPA: peptidase [Mycobacteriales bacterium]|nr:peptidase [Mycobacteriales bacterium]